MFPRLVCFQWKEPNENPTLFKWDAPSADIGPNLRSETFFGHSIAYDMGVLIAQWPDLLPLIFAAYREDRILCTQKREELCEIAKGNFQRLSRQKPPKGKPGPFSLAGSLKRRFGLEMAKGEETWRLRYGELRDVPLSAWPADAVKYALDDVIEPEKLYAAQEADHVSPDQYRQARADFWLKLCSAWGATTDPHKVDALETFIREEIREHTETLKSEGLLVPDNARLARLFEASGRPLDFIAPEWKRCQKLAMARLPEDWPHTDPSDSHPKTPENPRGGQPSLSEEYCDASTDPAIVSYGKYSSLATVLNKDVPLLREGIVHSSYGLADSGRSTSFGPNVQNFKVIQYGPKDGPKFGIRECFRPRFGWLYIAADFGGLELCTFAQTCLDLFGRSHMADLLNANQDPHLEMAANIRRISYEEAKAGYDAEAEAGIQGPFYLARQTAKVANFGFPGGLGAAALVEYAWGNYRVRLTEDEARELKRIWRQTFPESVPYFELVGRLTENGPAVMADPRSGRVRGGMRFTQLANTLFQGPGSNVAKAAGWAITERCHLRDWNSPLFGCRMVLFIHDEFVLEAPREFAPEAAEELSSVMVVTAKDWLPDVKIKAPALITGVWSKAAKPVRDARGRLIEWKPKAA